MKFLNALSAEAFNKKYPVGTRFNYQSVKDLTPVVASVTRSEAWALGHGDVVVKLEGIVGGVLITHLSEVSN